MSFDPVISAIDLERNYLRRTAEEANVKAADENLKPSFRELHANTRDAANAKLEVLDWVKALVDENRASEDEQASTAKGVRSVKSA